jgi:hypothetical protein
LKRDMLMDMYREQVRKSKPVNTDPYDLARHFNNVSNFTKR